MHLEPDGLFWFYCVITMKQKCDEKKKEGKALQKACKGSVAMTTPHLQCPNMPHATDRPLSLAKSLGHQECLGQETELLLNLKKEHVVLYTQKERHLPDYG